MCLYPRLIDNPKYKPNKKNGGKVPPFPIYNGQPDERVKYVPIACGKCMECKKQKANNWKIRLSEEIKYNKNTAHFVTLTFSPNDLKELNEDIDKTVDGYERENDICRLAVRRFLERWRKDNKTSVKHWLVTELGHKNTEHIHLHGLIFTDKSSDYIRNKWKYGYIYDNQEHKGYVNEKTINYIVKYIYKTDTTHKEYNPKIFTSAGIGSGYIDSVKSNDHKFKNENTKDYYQTRENYKIQNPIYYRNYLYTEEERETLWLNKLDKNERYVNGIKAENEEHYYKLLDIARTENSRLGYGNNIQDWNRKVYERQLRNIKFHEKIKIK